MSLINRMLSDLERRGARSPEQGVQAPAPGSRPGRRRRPWFYAAPIALALALVAVAAALLYQRWPAIAALWSSPEIVAPMASEETPAEGPSTSTEPSRPVLANMAFDTGGVGGAVELRLETSVPPEAPPAYERDDTAVRLQLPLAGAAGTALPAPPSDQDVVRELRLEAARQQPTLHLQVASDARLDVARGASGYVVTARAPTDANAAGVEDRAMQASADRTARDDATVTATDANGGGADPDDRGAAADAGEPTRQQDSARATETARAAGGDQGDGAATQAGEGSEAAPAGDDDAATASANDDPAGRSAEANADGEAVTAESDGDADAGDDDASVRADAQTDASVRAERRYRTARQALADGELARARSQLRAALEADANLHDARDLLVTLLRRAGAAETAREVLATGLERAPQRRAYAEPMARLLVDAGEIERAAEVLEQAAPAGGGDPGYHALRGAVAQRLERHERAITAYTRALEGDTSRGRWWLGLAISLAAADHPDEARSAFREARATGDLSERLDRWAQQRIEALASSAGD